MSKILRLVFDFSIFILVLGRNNIRKLEMIYKIKMINVVGNRLIVVNKSLFNFYFINWIVLLVIDKVELVLFKLVV